VKLFYSPTSPYVRKVMACAIARGLEARIEKVPCNPHDSPPALLEANPLSKVPCLVTDDGFALFDSPVICEYLDSRGEALPLFPAQGAARWPALRQQAMADGILDAAVTGRGELGKPREAARDATIARFKAVIARTLDVLEAEPPHKLVDIGSIAVACALGYLDFRYAGDPWRGTRPQLAAWQEAFAQNPCIADTAPRE
jgi:glutathione S-transferase